MQGPNVAPFTLGKQNLLLHTLRQLEKHFFVDHQIFRLGVCSHSEQLQQANATLIIVQNTLESGSIGLERVGSLVCHSVQPLKPAVLSVIVCMHNSVQPLTRAVLSVTVCMHRSVELLKELNPRCTSLQD